MNSVVPVTNPYQAPVANEAHVFNHDEVSWYGRLLLSVRILIKSGAYGILAFLIPMLFGTIALAVYRAVHESPGRSVSEYVLTASAIMGGIAAILAMPIYLTYMFSEGRWKRS